MHSKITTTRLIVFMIILVILLTMTVIFTVISDILGLIGEIIVGIFIPVLGLLGGTGFIIGATAILAIGYYITMMIVSMVMMIPTLSGLYTFWPWLMWNLIWPVPWTIRLYNSKLPGENKIK